MPHGNQHSPGRTNAGLHAVRPRQRTGFRTRQPCRTRTPWTFDEPVNSNSAYTFVSPTKITSRYDPSESSSEMYSGTKKLLWNIPAHGLRSRRIRPRRRLRPNSRADIRRAGPIHPGRNAQYKGSERCKTPYRDDGLSHRRKFSRPLLNTRKIPFQR